MFVLTMVLSHRGLLFLLFFLQFSCLIVQDDDIVCSARVPDTDICSSVPDSGGSTLDRHTEFDTYPNIDVGEYFKTDAMFEGRDSLVKWCQDLGRKHQFVVLITSLPKGWKKET